MQLFTILMLLILNHFNNITIIYLTIFNIIILALIYYLLIFLNISKYLTFTMLVSNIDIFNISYSLLLKCKTFSIYLK